MENTTSLHNFTGEKNYDSEFCGSIPLHLINLIQPHGFLLVLDEQLRIRQVSENAADFLSLSAEDLLEQPLSAFIPDTELEDLTHKLQLQHESEKISFSLTFKAGDVSKTFTATVHADQASIIIELEEGRSIDDRSFIEFFQQIKYITSRIKQTDNTAAIGQVSADELKRFTGFDRVLVYQFDPLWNGTVIGQAKEEDMSDLLGLRFPASDVPKQARDLYFKNPYRLIPTHDYKPVRLTPVINPVNQRFTDLSDCSLRSVASVHLEYMANMGITASMSLPIIIDNRLWGLISCHHKTAKYPGYQERTAMELIATIISVQLAAKEKETDSQLQAELRGIHSRLLEQLFSSSRFTDGLLEGPTTIMELLSLTGAAVIFEGEVSTVGKTPDHQKMRELISWLRRNSPENIFASNSLSALYPNSLDYADIASGLIALPINVEQNEYILGFRQEVLQTVNWSGNPDQAVRMEPDGKSYHPRNSFALYQETVKNTSLPWQEEEMTAAEALRGAVLEKILREKY
jgi:two-component system, chemotaxis family, sensor kinase Cph1